MNPLARMIDHTLLKPDASESDIEKLVAEAITHRFASVCVNGRWVSLVARRLYDAGLSREVHTCAVVGFPLGANRSVIKAIEASTSVKDGAQEIDMVIALDTLLAGDFDAARADIFEVVRAARAAGRDTLVKVILETAALTEPQIALGCRAAQEAGADFVKTSTGFHPKGGATPQTVAWLKHYAPTLQVKASGGIRDLPTAQQMLAAGATRLGTSASVSLLTNTPTTTTY